MRAKASTRLPGPGYKEVFGRGRSVKGRLTVAWRLERDGSAGPRAGVVVSRRSFHDAVDRNRAKRILREAFRILAAEDAAPPAADWVFVGRSSLRGKRRQDVEKEMRWIFRQG